MPTLDVGIAKYWAEHKAAQLLLEKMIGDPAQNQMLAMVNCVGFDLIAFAGWDPKANCVLDNVYFTAFRGHHTSTDFGGSYDREWTSWSEMLDYMVAISKESAADNNIS